ncbi:unnamed protein product [Rotaria sp. Silwood1]|nr:unnamed protein product [Rotaria sp. Silwood1]
MLMVGMYGLFQICRSDVPCISHFSTSTFIVCFLDDRQFITPLLIFVGCILMTPGLVHYASLSVLNHHSSRTMIAVIVFTYAALRISAFVTGRSSALGRCVLINNEYHDIQKYSTTNGNGL